MPFSKEYILYGAIGILVISLFIFIYLYFTKSSCPTKTCLTCPSGPSNPDCKLYFIKSVNN